MLSSWSSLNNGKCTQLYCQIVVQHWWLQHRLCHQQHRHFLPISSTFSEEEHFFCRKNKCQKWQDIHRIEFLPQQNIYYMTLLQMWQMWMIHFLQQLKSTLYLYKPEAEADFEGKTYLYDYCDCSIISWHAHTICLAIVNLINI